MTIIDTTALVTREVSIERVASEIRFLSLKLVDGIVTKLVPNWEQNIIKVSKPSVEKRSLCQQAWKCHLLQTTTYWKEDPLEFKF